MKKLKTYNWTIEIYNASICLSKLNHALLLLSKIENEQFPENKTIDFNKRISDKLLEYEDILSHKKIQVPSSEKGTFVLLFNNEFADILISNLTGNGLEIKNTGLSLKQNPENLFERFKKETWNQVPKGLTIVKKICDSYRLGIQYINDKNIHCLQISKS